MNIENITNQVVAFSLTVGGKLIGAVLLWIVGRWLIRLATRLITHALGERHIDATVSRYAASAVGALLNIALIVALLGYFGVETSTFAALLAAGGVAIGMAWSGLLAHFAAGVFMVVLRPFKAGDFVSAGGVLGTVIEVGLFVTKIDTMDNVRTLVGNNKIFSETIQNFSENHLRRVDLKAQIDHSVDPQIAINSLKTALATVANVSKKKAPDVEILEFNLAGTVLAVRPYCPSEHYWQVYFDTNRVIHEVGTQGNFAAPQTHHAISK